MKLNNVGYGNNAYGQTARCGRLKVMRKMEGVKGCEPLTVNNNGDTAMYEAVFGNQSDILWQLSQTLLVWKREL